MSINDSDRIIKFIAKNPTMYGLDAEMDLLLFIVVLESGRNQSAGEVKDAAALITGESRRKILLGKSCFRFFLLLSVAGGAPKKKLLSPNPQSTIMIISPIYKLKLTPSPNRDKQKHYSPSLWTKCHRIFPHKAQKRIGPIRLLTHTKKV